MHVVVVVFSTEVEHEQFIPHPAPSTAKASITPTRVRRTFLFLALPS